jgi:hypothetical protein
MSGKTNEDHSLRCPVISANKGTSMLRVADCPMSDRGLLIMGAQDKEDHQ